MKLRLQTDYSLRVLLYLAYVDRQVTSDEIAGAYSISKDHIVKVVQQLSRAGFVRTIAGRGGGLRLLRSPDEITVAEVVEVIEGRQGVLECIETPEICVMEPGCGLRRLVREAEDAFYEVLGSKTIADLSKSRLRGGLKNLKT